MRKVWKYSFPVAVGMARVMMPSIARLLHVDSQFGENRFTLWYLVDPESSPIERVFQVYPTGAEIHGEASYIGTIITHQGGEVWHLFQREEMSRESDPVEWDSTDYDAAPLEATDMTADDE